MSFDDFEIKIEDMDIDALWTKWIEEIDTKQLDRNGPLAYGFTRMRFKYWCYENCYVKRPEGRHTPSSTVIFKILELWTAMDLIIKCEDGYLIPSQYLPNSNSPDADK